MAKLILKFEEFGNTTKKVVGNVEDLEDVISHFEEFIRGCGYIFDGYLKIVDCDGCCGESHRDASEDLQSTLENFYKNVGRKKIYTMSELPTEEEIKSAKLKVEEDVNQMKFPFGDQNL